MKSKNIVLVVGILVLIPVVTWSVGDFPRRSVLKEIISIVTLVSFLFMIGQFFLTGYNRSLLGIYKMSSVVRYHKIIGYVFITILLIHPFLIIMPRFFEAGIKPEDAFLIILSKFDTSGMLLGLFAWITMLLIGITSFFRNNLPISYLNWKYLHGLLSVVFIVLASWHVVSLGRHTDFTLSIFIITLSITGVLLLFRSYFISFKISKSNE